MPFEEDLNEGRDNTFLSKERITSSIPRSSEEPSRSHPMNNHENEPKNNHFWMYPSTQMFYSALKRKGYETDPKDVDSMVAVHNSLNEQVWQEILLWEKPK